MMFDTVLDKTAHFTPESLMEQYADHTKPYYNFYMDTSGEARLECDGSIFAFDHLLVDIIGDYIRVFVYLKVLYDNYTDC